MALEWFKSELAVIGRNAGAELRVEKDPARLGHRLWVIERKLPEQTHKDALEYLQSQGLERYHGQVLIDQFGVERARREFDRAPEWAVAHICCVRDIAGEEINKDDPRAYREPNDADLVSVKRWLFEFPNAAAQLAAFRQEREDFTAKKEADARQAYVKDVRSSHVFRDLEFYDSPEQVLQGTEI